MRYPGNKIIWNSYFQAPVTASVTFIIWTASSEFGTYRPRSLARTSAARSYKSRGTFGQKARSLAPLNGWACAVKIYHDGMLKDTNSLDGAHLIYALLGRFSRPGILPVQVFPGNKSLCSPCNPTKEKQIKILIFYFTHFPKLLQYLPQSLLFISLVVLRSEWGLCI